MANPPNDGSTNDQRSDRNAQMRLDISFVGKSASAKRGPDVDFITLQDVSI
jgi:hypothetical protein